MEPAQQLSLCSRKDILYLCKKYRIKGAGKNSELIEKLAEVVTESDFDDLHMAAPTNENVENRDPLVALKEKKPLKPILKKSKSFVGSVSLVDQRRLQMIEEKTGYSPLKEAPPVEKGQWKKRFGLNDFVLDTESATDTAAAKSELSAKLQKISVSPVVFTAAQDLEQNGSEYQKKEMISRSTLTIQKEFKDVAVQTEDFSCKNTVSSSSQSKTPKSDGYHGWISYLDKLLNAMQSPPRPVQKAEPIIQTTPIKEKVISKAVSSPLKRSKTLPLNLTRSPKPVTKSPARALTPVKGTTPQKKPIVRAKTQILTESTEKVAKPQVSSANPFEPKKTLVRTP
jgi:hypothetical protein